MIKSINGPHSAEWLRLARGQASHICGVRSAGTSLHVCCAPGQGHELPELRESRGLFPREARAEQPGERRAQVRLVVSAGGLPNGICFGA